MPAEAADKRARLGNLAARRDIRRAEASRMLGVLDTTELAARAAQWITDGADTANVRALVAAPRDASTDGIRQALVREIAGELGLGFDSQQAARSFHAEEIIRARTFSMDVGAQIYGLSNGLTDELVRKLRGFVARLIQR